MMDRLFVAARAVLFGTLFVTFWGWVATFVVRGRGVPAPFDPPRVFVATVLWLSLAHLFVVLYEERALAGRFGSGHLDYCRRVGRWLPVNPTRRGHRS